MELLLAGSAALRGASLLVKAKRCGNLADAGVGGLGFDGAFQTKVRFAQDLIVKSEAIDKSGAQWPRKRKVDQRAREAHFDICGHE